MADEKKTRTQADLQAMYSPWVKGQDESLIDYYARLSQNRKGGILGTAGLMDVPISDKDAGEVKKNTPVCPAGYSWNGNACVPTRPEESEGEGPVYTKGEKLQQAVDRFSGRGLTPDQMLMAALPAGGLLSALGEKAGLSADSYIGMDKDKAMIAESMAASGATEGEIERVMADPEKTAYMHGIGMMGEAPVYDYIPNTGFGANLKDRFSNGVMGLFGPNYGGAISNEWMSTAPTGPNGTNLTSLQTGMFSGSPAFTHSLNTEGKTYTRTIPTSTDSSGNSTSTRTVDYTPRHEFNAANFTSDKSVIDAHSEYDDGSQSSSSNSSKWLCSKMLHMGKWKRKDAMATWKWHAAQPEHWKRGYDVWGKFLAKHVLNNDFWASVMQEWTEHKVMDGKKTWKAMLGSVMIAPCWIAGFFNNKPSGEFQLAKKSEVM